MAKVLCLDPSGNFKDEGQGTTGWAIFHDGELVDFGAIEAHKYPKQELYWDVVSDLVIHNADILLCESYKLFEHKAKSQSWSALETSQLIGYLRMVCFHHGITYLEQDPACKVRVADPQLEHMGIIQKKGRNYTCMDRQTNLHMRDAIRHGIFFHRYGKGKTL